MKKILIAVLILLGFQMCSQQKLNKPTVELDTGIDILLADYKDQLGVEDIHINYQDSSLYNDSVNIVHVILFNPPKSEDFYHLHLSLGIASKIYKHLINKNEFGRIDIDYLYEGEYLSNPYFNKQHKFSYKEIQEFINKSK